jgi:hypothetical protein
MVTLSRPIDLISKYNPDVFLVLNQAVFGTIEQPLGSTHGAVNRIIAPEFTELLKVLMPSILSLNPEDMTWFKRVKNYWDSFGIKIPIGGKRLETGFNFSFDVNDATRGENIRKLIKVAETVKVTIKDDESLKVFVMSDNISEFNRYKYGSPINNLDYLIWLFCLGHRKVAKQTSALEKTTQIEFILIDPREIEDTRRAQHSVSIEATKKYLEIITDRAMVKNILYIKGFDPSTFDDLDADAKLKHLVDTAPKEFLKIANDSTTTTRATIERYIVAGILRRLPSSSIVVDGLDSGIVIGNTDAEAVTYFKSESVDRVAKVSEFKTRYASTSKK